MQALPKRRKYNPFHRFVRARGMNLRGVAERAGIDYWRIYFYNCGMRKLSEDDLSAVARALEVQPEQLPRPKVNF